MSSFMQRFLSALILVPLILVVFWVGGLLLKIVAAIIFIMAFYEFSTIAYLERKLGVRYGLTAFAAFYCFLGFVAAISLPVTILLFLVLSVWASDIGGYTVGKLVGGPKLAPTISPNKTIAGLFGACLFPALLLCIPMAPDYHLAAVIGIMIGLIGQTGDIFVSYLKRRVNIKDTGRIIPGHGGILDRIDALMLVLIVTWIIMTVAQ